MRAFGGAGERQCETELMLASVTRTRAAPDCRVGAATLVQLSFMVVPLRQIFQAQMLQKRSSWGAVRRRPEALRALISGKSDFLGMARAGALQPPNLFTRAIAPDPRLI